MSERRPEMLRRELTYFLVALQFLTRVPVPSFNAFEPGWLTASTRYFAWVGALVGAAVVAALALASMWWPPPLAAVVAVALGVWLTGGFHEDGLADTWDALGGAVSRERALVIMKDSRLGTYGALALFLVMLTKIVALWAALSVSTTAAIAGLLLGHTVGRAGTVLLIRLMVYAGDEAHAKAKPLARRASATAVWSALATVALVAGLLLLYRTPAVVVAVAVVVGLAAILATGWWLQRRLGGYTGDGLGASEQHAECAVLLAVVAAWSWV